MKTLGIIQTFSTFNFGDDYFIHSFFAITNTDCGNITVKFSDPLVRKFDTKKDRDKFFSRLENIKKPIEKRKTIDKKAWDFATEAKKTKAEHLVYNSKWKSENGRWPK